MSDQSSSMPSSSSAPSSSSTPSSASTLFEWTPVNVDDLPEESDENPSARRCPCCLEYLSNTATGYEEEPIKVACGHVFGKTCITNWLNEYMEPGLCPQCRVPLISESLVHVKRVRMVRHYQKVGVHTLRKDAERLNTDPEFFNPPHCLHVMTAAIETTRVAYIFVNMPTDGERLAPTTEAWKWYRESDLVDDLFKWLHERSALGTFPEPNQLSSQPDASLDSKEREAQKALELAKWLDWNAGRCFRSMRSTHKNVAFNEDARHFIRDTIVRILNHYISWHGTNLAAAMALEPIELPFEEIEAMLFRRFSLSGYPSMADLPCIALDLGKHTGSF